MTRLFCHCMLVLALLVVQKGLGGSRDCGLSSIPSEVDSWMLEFPLRAQDVATQFSRFSSSDYLILYAVAEGVASGRSVTLADIAGEMGTENLRFDNGLVAHADTLKQLGLLKIEDGVADRRQAPLQLGDKFSSYTQALFQTASTAEVASKVDLHRRAFNAWKEVFPEEVPFESIFVLHSVVTRGGAHSSISGIGIGRIFGRVVSRQTQNSWMKKMISNGLVTAKADPTNKTRVDYYLAPRGRLYWDGFLKAMAREAAAP